MRVLVCGGRDYSDWQRVWAVLDEFHSLYNIDVVIHGAARGADTLASDWAHNRNVPVEPYRAQWNTHSNASGPIRNIQMLVEGKPDIVIAFPGGKGTDNMKTQATAAGVAVVEG